MKRLVASLLGALTICVAARAQAANTPEELCASAKRKLVGQAIGALTKCDFKAISVGLELTDATVTACIDAAKARFTSGWADAQSDGGCVSEVDLDTIEDAIDALLEDLENLLGGSGTPSKCTSAKMKGLGKTGRCRLICGAKAAREDAEFEDPGIIACLQKCSDKLPTYFDKAEVKDDCELPDDDADLFDGLLDDFLEEMNDRLPTSPSTTTTTTLPVTCDGSGSIDLPTDLPQQLLCTADSNPAVNATCNGWKPIPFRPKPPPDPPDAPRAFEDGELTVSNGPAATALLYEWEPNPNPKGSVCWYLYREPVGPAGVSGNGLLCFDRETCDVCAFDKFTFFCSLDPTTTCNPGADACPGLGKGICITRPSTLSDLDTPGPFPFDNCSRCHASGTVTPKKRFFSVVSGRTKRVNRICASKGGPNWVNGHTTWSTRAMMHAVTAPVDACDECHSTGFVNPLYVCSGDSGYGCDSALADPCPGLGKGLCTNRTFCNTILAATFADHAEDAKKGAMRGRFPDTDTCYSFATAMNCTGADLGCPTTTTTTTTTMP